MSTSSLLTNGPRLSGFASCYGDKTHSDLTLVLGGQKFHVHKVILCAGSDCFKALLAGGFKEQNEKEITLHDDDPNAFAAFLRYLYGYPYDGLSGEPNKLTFHVAIHVVADKYLNRWLASEATENFETDLESKVDSNEFIAAIDTVYSTEGTQLTAFKSAIESASLKHLPKLDHKADFEEMRDRYGEFRSGIIDHFVSEALSRRPAAISAETT